MNEDAIKYLESIFHARLLHRGRYAPTLSRSEYEGASVVTHGGVTASRPMFELIDDHENANKDGVCWMCVK